MNDDFFVSNGLNSAKMARFARSIRTKCQVETDENINIVAILEFNIPEIVPGFKLVIRRDLDLESLAQTTVHPPRIYVRQSIYEAARSGDAESRRILAHELGHLLLHGDKPSNLNVKNNGGRYRQQFRGLKAHESTETQADMFARHFLISIGLALRLKDHPIELAQRTGTSVSLAKGSITLAKRLDVQAS